MPLAAKRVYESMIYACIHCRQVMDPAAKMVMPMSGMIQCSFACALHPYQKSPTGMRSDPTNMDGMRNSGRPFLGIPGGPPGSPGGPGGIAGGATGGVLPCAL